MVKSQLPYQVVKEYDIAIHLSITGDFHQAPSFVLGLEIIFFVTPSFDAEFPYVLTYSSANVSRDLFYYFSACQSYH